MQHLGIEDTVRNALAEDIGAGDITAALIPAERIAAATVISRDEAVISGRPWVDEVFRQVDPQIKVQWHISEGDQVCPNTRLFSLTGPARSLLTAERTALNFLQTLSATSSRCRHYADLVDHTQVRILDTRKTLPGLRLAQKYAVTQGGCFNHRIGLFDAFLIKENHIMACGGIAQAVSKARELAPGKPVEVEVENHNELQQALEAGADIIMLDNFTLQQMRDAVAFTAGRARLEASGNVTDLTLVPIAETGVDYISIGGLTKDCKAVDLSMRFSSEVPAV
ncbi:nicotinate-nucleotide diphosphorylase (carboxylating) [Pokkaliibacter plantistimulans]|uniref:Probable nicotinate-nucleotide pyrophosphorylase [carboxylating] n=1 Tax=Proteobacteria bacterium 228 TaxID=2083153 RepID=A0A2S5KYE3_9PROT|nr:carboxylating nicotinate-nucleotide diphosphorylase [Pokkaliibacter plantistimulans]PPC79286.1 nicotinate-nucleotide diphosphorylase (carboxylating) [Pokkaliibacter plantistimulans]